MNYVKKKILAIALVFSFVLLGITAVNASAKDFELNVEYTLGDEIKFSDYDNVYIKVGWEQESVYGNATVTLEEEDEYYLNLRIGYNNLWIDKYDYYDDINDGKTLTGVMFTGGDGSHDNPYVLRLVFKEKESTWDGNGSGTEEDPYLIENLADLKKLATNVNTEKMNYKDKYFKLTTNINTGDDNWTPIGSNIPFKGSFDGDGHTITYKITNGGEEVGLFAKIESATIKNINVDGSVEGTERVGGLAGYIRNTTIINCASSVDVKGNYFAGGLVGSSDESNISYIVVSGEINVTGYRNGGLVGVSYETPISNSVFKGKINENSSGNEFDVIAGYNNHTLYDNIPNCYYLDTSKPSVGGIHGESKNAAEINTIALSAKEAGYGVYADALLTYITVTFDANGGSAIPSQEVYIGGKASKPTVPTNGNLHFIGWFVNPTLANIINLHTFTYNTFDFNSTITSDITLKALWGTRLNVNTNGGGKLAIAAHGGELEFDEDYPTTSVSEFAIIGLYDYFDVAAKANEGYHFVKWTKDGADYSTNSNVTVSLVDDVVELVAIFEIDEFTVTFKDYDGSVIDTQQVPYYTSAFEPEEPTREGYTFTGWDKSFDNITEDLIVTAQYEITQGEVEVKEVEGNVGSATASLNNKNVKELIDLSTDEQNAIEAGKDIYVFVEVDDISDSVSTEDTELVKTKLEDGSVVGMYLDINLFKQIDGENKVKVSETTGKIKISFEIPESFKSSNREFYIIRIHGTEVTKIIPTVNGNTLTFETDKFSTYALAYTDSVEKNTTDETTKTVEDNKIVPTQTNSENNPHTGDNMLTYISIIVVSVIGFVGVGLYTKKKRFN